MPLECNLENVTVINRSNERKKRKETKKKVVKIVCLLTASPSRCKARHCSEVRICTVTMHIVLFRMRQCIKTIAVSGTYHDNAPLNHGMIKEDGTS